MAKTQSYFALGQIYENENAHIKSAKYLEYLNKNYPFSTIFSAMLMQNYYNYQNKYDDVIKTGKNALSHIPANEIPSKVFGDFIIYLTAKSYAHLGNYGYAKIYIEKYLALPGQRQFSKEAKNLLQIYVGKLK